MSGEAVGYVFRHSPFKGATFTVHVAIADSVSDVHANEFWMAQANLNSKARLGERAVREAITSLVDAGFIEPCEPEMLDPKVRAKAGRPTRWRFLFPDAAVVFESRKRPSRTPARNAGVADQNAGDPRQQMPGTPAPGADVTQENPSTEPKGAKPRERFAEFDALVEAFGGPGTKEEAGFYAKVARGLKANGKTPAEIADRGKRARSRHPECTVNILLTRWSNFAPRGPAPGSTLDDVAQRDLEARR